MSVPRPSETEVTVFVCDDSNEAMLSEDFQPSRYFFQLESITCLSGKADFIAIVGSAGKPRTVSPPSNASLIRSHIAELREQDTQDRGRCSVIPALRLALLIASSFATARIIAFVGSEVEKKTKA